MPALPERRRAVEGPSSGMGRLSSRVRFRELIETGSVVWEAEEEPLTDRGSEGECSGDGSSVLSRYM